MGVLNKAQLDSDAMAGRRFGAWTVAQLDPTGRRALCICACSSRREIALVALEAGDSRGCGCSATPTMRRPVRLSAGFAADLAASESRAGRKRHFGAGYEKGD